MASTMTEHVEIPDDEVESASPGEALRDRKSRELGQPLYRQLVDLMTGEIERGVIRPGERLPTEAELGDKFGLSRITVRQALAVLTREGLIERFPGRGSFVVERPSRTSWELKSVGDLLQIAPKTEVVSWRLVQPPLKVSVFLKTSEPCHRLRAIRFFEGQPVFYTENYIRPELGAQLSVEEFEDRTILELITNRIGVPIEQVDEEIEAGIADEPLAKRLAIAPGQPVLIQHVEMFGENGFPLQRGTGWWRGDKFKRRYALKRGA